MSCGVGRGVEHAHKRPRIDALLAEKMEDLQHLLEDQGLAVAAFPGKGRCLFTSRDFYPGEGFACRRSDHEVMLKLYIQRRLRLEKIILVTVSDNHRLVEALVAHMSELEEKQLLLYAQMATLVNLILQWPTS